MIANARKAFIFCPQSPGAGQGPLGSRINARRAVALAKLNAWKTSILKAY